MVHGAHARSKATLTVYCHWMQQRAISCCSADSFWILNHCFLAAKKGSKALVPGTSCKDILDSGDAQGDGEYWIDPTASGDPFRVYCDMVTDGGKFKSLPSFQTSWLAFKEQGTRFTRNGAASSDIKNVKCHTFQLVVTRRTQCA